MDAADETAFVSAMPTLRDERLAAHPHLVPALWWGSQGILSAFGRRVWSEKETLRTAVVRGTGVRAVPNRLHLVPSLAHLAAWLKEARAWQDIAPRLRPLTPLLDAVERALAPTNDPIGQAAQSALAAATLPGPELEDFVGDVARHGRYLWAVWRHLDLALEPTTTDNHHSRVREWLKAMSVQFIEHAWVLAALGRLSTSATDLPALAAHFNDRAPRIQHTQITTVLGMALMLNPNANASLACEWTTVAHDVGLLNPGLPLALLAQDRTFFEVDGMYLRPGIQIAPLFVAADRDTTDAGTRFFAGFEEMIVREASSEWVDIFRRALDGGQGSEVGQAVGRWIDTAIPLRQVDLLLKLGRIADESGIFWPSTTGFAVAALRRTLGLAVDPFASMVENDTEGGRRWSGRLLA